MRSSEVRIPGTSSLAELLQMADVLDTGCMVVDEDLVIQGWNRWLESATDLPAAAVVNRTVKAVFGLDENTIAIRSLRRAINGEAVVLARLVPMLCR